MSHNQTEILNRLHERFGESLQSVALFGSQARGTGHAFSDIDLLIVLKDAPRELRGRRQLASSIRRQLGLPIDSTILRTDAFVYSVRYLAPLMIELARDYEVWYDRDGFFCGNIGFIQALMRQGKLVEMQAGVWKFTEKIDEMARDGAGVLARSSL